MLTTSKRYSFNGVLNLCETEAKSPTNSRSKGTRDKNIMHNDNETIICAVQR